MMNKDLQKTPWQKAMYLLLPVVSIGVLMLAWFAVSTSRPDLFPGPAATWERFNKLLAKPLGRIPLGTHILDSLRRVGIAVGLSCFFRNYLRRADGMEPVFQRHHGRDI